MTFGSRTTSCRRLRGFVQKDLVATLLDHVQRSKRYNTQRDSVDDMVPLLNLFGAIQMGGLIVVT